MPHRFGHGSGLTAMNLLLEPPPAFPPVIPVFRVGQESRAIDVRPALPSPAEHDFLVPNPRPDLILDPAFLGMLCAG